MSPFLIEVLESENPGRPRPEAVDCTPPRLNSQPQSACRPPVMESATIMLNPECDADLDSDVDVDAADLAELLASWGVCAACPADFDGDRDVDAADLAQLLGNWGPCTQ